jgi:hypothetical protein
MDEQPTQKIWGGDANNFPHGGLNWSALSALARAKVRAPTTVDLSELKVARPYVLASIAALGCLGNRKAELVLPTDENLRDEISSSGLPDFFAASHADPAVAETLGRVHQVRAVAELSVIDKLTKEWEKQLGGMSAGLRQKIANHLDEIAKNALAHAAPVIHWCIITAQTFADEGYVEVAVLDTGSTVLHHLRQNPDNPYVQDDFKALHLATQEGVTGTPSGAINPLGEQNSGIGLFELREYCKAGMARVSIVSGDALVTFGQAGEPIEHAFPGGFPGCLVNIRFHL